MSVALQPLAQGISQALESVAGESLAFVLLVSVDGTTQYVSNASRTDGVELIKSLRARWEANRADIPAHYNPDLKGKPPISG
ncbi:hypothetical protein [Azohydromonas aeria]|uniref:hypothetical protein n=1 Tax=Azohydromonas aeria TaxID=2590212 RepID=UPI0012F9E3C5|nr:hypothetical protein [Azohydromonas aeria]